MEGWGGKVGLWGKEDKRGWRMRIPEYTVYMYEMINNSINLKNNKSPRKINLEGKCAGGRGKWWQFIQCPLVPWLFPPGSAEDSSPRLTEAHSSVPTSQVAMIIC